MIWRVSLQDRVVTETDASIKPKNNLPKMNVHFGESHAVTEIK